MVSFLHVWALGHFVELARALGREADAGHYEAMRACVADTCRRELWDGDWYLRGITADGRKIGTHVDTEGKVHLESNAWAVLSGAADAVQGRKSHGCCGYLSLHRLGTAAECAFVYKTG